MLNKVEPRFDVVGADRIAMRCPACLREGILDERGSDRQLRIFGRLWAQNKIYSGERICPNPECRALIYVIYNGESGEILASFPPERIDFDASELPSKVQATFEEAIECHAHACFRAAAVMVRRTLEVVCEDQGATGENLYQRIEDLGKRLVLPKGFLGGIHNLRILGNDAAHVEARDYEDIGKHEVEIALEITKVIIHATYQMNSIVNSLENLKRSQVDT
jgi:hypothetical protein